MRLHQKRQLAASALPDALSARDRFGKYKNEDPKEARQVEVRGDELEQLRRKREMLRSMTPEQALQVIEFHKDLNFFEAFVLAKMENKLIIPNDVIDRIITKGKYFRVWTGTLVAYETHSKKFGDQIVYPWDDYSISLKVPPRFRGQKGCALVIEHPDFDLAYLGNNAFELIADESRLRLLEDFPSKNSYWYRYDETSRIPVGSSQKQGIHKKGMYKNCVSREVAFECIQADMRFLLREKRSFVGPLGRRFQIPDGLLGRGMGSYAPVLPLGVALF